MKDGWLGRPRAWWERRTASLQDRIVGGVLAVPTGGVLAVARVLTPAADGVGTHTQLGLGGCTVLALTGQPCPMCGMTTTFSHLAHLQPIEAMVNQPFGVVLFSCTVALFAVGLADLLHPRARWRRLLELTVRNEVWVAGGMLVGLALGWVYKVVKMGL